MVYDKEVLEIFDKLRIFESLYELIRFVDPVRKKVLTYKDEVLNEVDSNCFNNWNKNKFCVNCTSIRAYNEKKTFMKMEHNNKNVYTVTSIPLKLADTGIVIELLKNASLSMSFNDCDTDSQSNIYKTIDSMNSILLNDSLTDIYNRRYISEVLPVNIAMANILDKNFSIIMTDIDFFKTINDNYGHLAGDIVLKEFASLLEEHLLNESDWVARYGGEEFIIGINNATRKDVVSLADKIRLAVEDKIFYYENHEIKITSSFGVATINDSVDCSNYNAIIDCADQNLYIAKNGGRNRFEFKNSL